jgi:hypothetical protein
VRSGGVGGRDGRGPGCGCGCGRGRRVGVLLEVVQFRGWFVGDTEAELACGSEGTSGERREARARGPETRGERRDGDESVPDMALLYRKGVRG